MIKANELRIGNYILAPDNTIVKVESILKNSINQLIDGDGVAGSYSLNDFNAIPLQPELFGKCGFYTEGTAQIWWNLEYFFKDEKTPFKSTRRVFTIKKKNGQYCYLNCYKIPYLHQLQNLYFALTGEELEINL